MINLTKLTEFFDAKLDLSDKDSDQFKAHIKRLLEYGIDVINFAKYKEPPVEVINGDAFMVPKVKPQKLIMVKISDILDNYKTPGYLSNLMNPVLTELAKTEYERYLGIRACKRLNEKFPWTNNYSTYFSYELDDEDSMWLLVENEKTGRKAIIIENLKTNEYKVEFQPGSGGNLVPATEDNLSKFKNYIEGN